MDTKTYTVSQVSRMAHVTVRALHHYDEIGLLTPSRRAANGYRLYTADDLKRLQQILIFKELGFTLDAIESLLIESPAEQRSALIGQRQRLQGELGRTAAVLRAIDNAIQLIDGKETMDENRMFDGFEAFQSPEHAAEAKQRWGHTDAYQESTRRARQYTKADWQRMKAESDGITRDLAALMQSGQRADDAAVLTLVEQHRLHIDRWFYPCSRELHAALGEMYVSDSRFTATYDQVSPGLAVFVRDAMRANLERASGD